MLVLVAIALAFLVIQAQGTDLVASVTSVNVKRLSSTHAATGDATGGATGGVTGAGTGTVGAPTGAFDGAADGLIDTVGLFDGPALGD